MKKRILSILLAACMLCGLLPTTALGAAGDTFQATLGTDSYNFTILEDGTVELIGPATGVTNICSCATTEYTTST